ncbi:hypothetical protein [Thermococcus zilligii]|uniref:hypothetical protein n=1 Tax=Thermococcus zilligii TaxID=54076 RepID=UPI000299F73C|nr:hypothetical protein [Thermococcus zilligii]
MKPGRKLVLEAVLVPLMIVMAFWGLYYFHPRVPSQKMNITISGLMTAVVSFFIALVVAIFMLKRRLEKEHNSRFPFRDLPHVIDKTDLEIIQDSARDIVFVILMWGSLSTAIVDMGFERGIIYIVNFLMICAMICLPMFLAVAVLFIDFPVFLYAHFIGKESPPGSREILLGSLVSLSSLVGVGLVANYSDVRIDVIRPILNFYGKYQTVYRYVLLLSALDALYGLVGILILPRRRRLGLLTLLMIALALIPLLIKVFVQLHSL